MRHGIQYTEKICMVAMTVAQKTDACRKKKFWIMIMMIKIIAMDR